MIINIQKEKAIEREKMKRISWVFIGTFIWSIVLIGCYNFFQLLSFNETYALKPSLIIYALIFMILWEYIFYKLFLIEIDSLEYEIDEEENRLISKWKVILKHKDTAKLQVINSVDINQDIWDKFQDLYSVNVCYGFSGDGYDYEFNYLSEEEAEKLLKIIKPSGRIGVDLK